MREDYCAFPSQAEGLVQLQIRGYSNYSVFVRNPRTAGHVVFVDAHLVRSVLEVIAEAIAEQPGFKHTMVQAGNHLEEMRVVAIIKGGRGSHATVYAPHGKDVIEALAAVGYKKPEKH